MEKIIEALLLDRKFVTIKGIEIELRPFKLKTSRNYIKKREKEAILTAKTIMELIEN